MKKTNNRNRDGILLVFLLFQYFTGVACSNGAAIQNSNLFREYIGAEFKNVSFSDVPIHPDVRFDFILSFAIDYTTGNPPIPANGNFSIFWDSHRLSPSAVAAIKAKHRNVRVALSLGGDSVGEKNASFSPASVGSWVSNAVSSLSRIIQTYHLDGIDIDYEHFAADPKTFAECIGRLIRILKRERLISTASIAPFGDAGVQSHYIQLWKKYARLIDYVNFQFYAYGRGTTVAEFERYLSKQVANYGGGKVLVSFISDGSLGLSLPDFFTACRRLKKENKLYGIFVWCADDSKHYGFRYEKEAQALLALPSSPM